MNSDSIQGKAEKGSGQVKESAGNLSGNDHLKAEGAREKLKGELRDTMGAVKQAGQDIAEGAKEGTEKARANLP